MLHSLAIAKVIQFKPMAEVLDVGTGGGFPGVPLAVMFPETHFTLIDSIGKKIKVVSDVIERVGLTNAKAMQIRAEQLEGEYDFIVSRAVTTLGEFVPWVKGMALIVYLYNRRVAELKRREAEQLLRPIRKVLEESRNPQQLQQRISNILDNQERYQKSVTRSVEADKEEVMKNTRPFMERVMEIVEANYTDSEFGVQEFCDALGMSRSVVSKHLNAEAGLPAGQFLRNYRLNMAKELLSAKTGNRNITEIAYAVGFNDPKYFTRCFTKMYGMSPSAYNQA